MPEKAEQRGDSEKAKAAGSGNPKRPSFPIPHPTPAGCGTGDFGSKVESEFRLQVKPAQPERGLAMAGRFQITCINKPHRDSPVEHITHVGGYGSGPWKLTVEDVIRRIESHGSDHEDFFVRVGNAEADVFVVSPPGRRKYIKTVPDYTKRDNLLSLPECP